MRNKKLKRTLRKRGKSLAGLRRVRKLSEVLAETRERQKERPLKSPEEVMTLLRKG